jgi:hypothetical protein
MARPTMLTRARHERIINLLRGTSIVTARSSTHTRSGEVDG